MTELTEIANDLSLEELQAEHGETLPKRELMQTCTPIVVFILVDGVFISSTTLVCAVPTVPGLPV